MHGVLVALRGREVIVGQRDRYDAGPTRVGQHRAVRSEDDDSSAGRRELIDQPLGWMENAGGVDILSERPASVLGVGKQGGVERPHELRAED